MLHKWFIVIYPSHKPSNMYYITMFLDLRDLYMYLRAHNCWNWIGSVQIHKDFNFLNMIFLRVFFRNSASSYKTSTNTAIAEHPLYNVYLWVSETLLRLGPIVTLTILNILIIVRYVCFLIVFPFNLYPIFCFWKQGFVSVVKAEFT